MPDAAGQTDARPRHLLTLWNPAYAADALDEHVRLRWTSPTARAKGGAPQETSTSDGASCVQRTGMECCRTMPR